MAKNFKELQQMMSPERQERNAAAAKVMMDGMGLVELREAMSLTQESLAQALHLKQASVSKMERRSDMYLSTLRKIIEAMGGTLELIANMPQGRVRIQQFRQVRKA